MVIPAHIWSLALVVLNYMSEQVLSSSPNNRFPDYRHHHCDRDCDSSPKEMTCVYDFTLEYYYTLTQACHNCPFNVTDCFRPHCIAADGVSRGLLTVNRMMPGPAIRVCEDDDIVVNVKNNMEGGEGTAIHWHGVLQTKTPHMDGVSMLTQCPIHQYSNFQYKFKADTPGTHFWHAHAGLQRADGVYGAVVIKQRKADDPQSNLYDYDEADHTILLHDWITEMGAERFSGHHHAMVDHSPSSILINGRGTGKEFEMSNSNLHSAHGGHMMHTMEMPSDVAPTSNPLTHHMTHPDSDFNNNMDAIATMSHSDMESMMQEHVGRKRRGAESPQMPSNDHSDHQMSDMDSKSSRYTPQSVFTVKPMKRYRFRVISNGVNNCPIQFSVDNHTMTMIATDGSPFKPLQVESFNIFAGERYDFVLFTNNHVGNYWIRTRGLADCMFKRAKQTAILRYEGTMPRTPRESMDYEYFERKGMILNPFNRNSGPLEINVYQLESVSPDEHPLKAVPDKQFYLAFDFNMVDNYRFNDPDLYPLSNMIGHAHHMGSPQINGITHKMPSSPPLSQYSKYTEKDFCNEDTIIKNCKTEFCECIHRIKVNVGEEVELILVDEGKLQDNNHPMHLHGYKFKVLSMGKLGNSTSVSHVKRLDSMGLISRNFNNPIAKDTVTVPDGGYTVIRFHATNPGFWLFHCHIAFHMEMGMNMIIQVGEPHEMLPAPKHFPTCGDWTPEAVSMLEVEEAQNVKQKQLSCPPASSAVPASTSIPPLHQVYLGGIQQTTDVNLTDVTLHYALLLWMTGRKDQATAAGAPGVLGAGAPPPGGHIQNIPNRTALKSALSMGSRTRKGKSRKRPVVLNRNRKLPLFNVHSANPSPGSLQAARSSIIELSQLPKMLVPANQIERIVTNGNNIPKDTANGKLSSQKMMHMRSMHADRNAPNVTVHVDHHKQNQRKVGHRNKKNRIHHPNNNHVANNKNQHHKQRNQRNKIDHSGMDHHPSVKIVSKLERNHRINGHSMHAAIKRSNNATDAAGDVLQQMERRIKSFTIEANAAVNDSDTRQHDGRTPNDHSSSRFVEIAVDATAVNNNTDAGSDQVGHAGSGVMHQQHESQHDNNRNQHNSHGITNQMNHSGHMIHRGPKQGNGQSNIVRKDHNRTKHVNHIVNREKKKHIVQNVIRNMTHEKNDHSIPKSHSRIHKRGIHRRQAPV